MDSVSLLTSPSNRPVATPWTLRCAQRPLGALGILPIEILADHIVRPALQAASRKDFCSFARVSRGFLQLAVGEANRKEKRYAERERQVHDLIGRVPNSELTEAALALRESVPDSVEAKKFLESLLPVDLVEIRLRHFWEVGFQNRFSDDPDNGLFPGIDGKTCFFLPQHIDQASHVHFAEYLKAFPNSVLGKLGKLFLHCQLAEYDLARTDAEGLRDISALEHVSDFWRRTQLARMSGYIGRFLLRLDEQRPAAEYFRGRPYLAEPFLRFSLTCDQAVDGLGGSIEEDALYLANLCQASGRLHEAKQIMARFCEANDEVTGDPLDALDMDVLGPSYFNYVLYKRWVQGLIAWQEALDPDNMSRMQALDVSLNLFKSILSLKLHCVPQSAASDCQPDMYRPIFPSSWQSRIADMCPDSGLREHERADAEECCPNECEEILLASSLCNIGFNHMLRRQPTSALSAFDSVLVNFPVFTRALVGKMTVLNGVGRCAEAKDFAVAAMHANPDKTLRLYARSFEVRSCLSTFVWKEVLGWFIQFSSLRHCPDAISRSDFAYGKLPWRARFDPWDRQREA